MSGTRWCENCGWWVVGEHGPDVCEEFKKSAGVISAQGGDMSEQNSRTVAGQMQTKDTGGEYECRVCGEKKVGLDHTLERCKQNMTKSASTEAVHHPKHYGGDTPYEAIKVIEAWGLGFSLGNCVKYISRAGKKSANIIEDLKKAEWYLKREIERLEKE